MRPRQYVTGTRHFSVEPSERTKGNEYKPELKKKNHRKNLSFMEQAAPGGCGLSIL